MDEFLSDIHTLAFKQWILGQNRFDYKIFLSEKNENIIIIETPYSHSEITFNKMNIIELTVTNTTNDNIEFYLHFQMKTLKHATELFEEMLECIKKLVDKPVIKVLLSCTGGLTTGFFAEKLNEAVDLLSLDFKFAAVPYGDLFEAGTKYDVILLAPQISYMHAKVQEILRDKVVLKLPSAIFAKYDAKEAIELVQHEYNSQGVTKPSPASPLALKQTLNNGTKILSIGVIRLDELVNIVYRVYDENNNIIDDNEIIKNRISLDDICDILDVVLVKYNDIKLVGLSMPGIINDGHLTLLRSNFADCDVINFLSNRYPQKFTLSNDVNCVAVGYYISQNEYSSLSFLFQPRGGFPGGVGNIYKGQLIKGRKNVAGEVQFLPLALSDDFACLSKTPEGSIELVAKTLVSIISILDPEILVISCHLVKQVDELYQEIEKHIPSEYIPKIEKIDDMKEYILLGQMALCLQNK